MKDDHEKNNFDLKNLKAWCMQIPFFKEMILKEEKLAEEDYLELAR
jgi:hypothetical protein